MQSAKNKSLFDRFFPIPKFLSIPAVGIDISDNSIHFIEFANKYGNKILKNFGSCIVPEGIVSKGEVQNEQALTDILKNIKEKYNMNLVRVSLPEEKAYLFQTQVPYNVNNQDIVNILEFKLEEYVPLTPSSAVFDYDILSKHKNNENHLDVVVAVYPKQTIEKYTSVFKNAGLIPLSLELEAQAIVRAIIKDGDMGTYMIVDFGKTKIGLSVISSGVLSFTSTLEFEREALTDVAVGNTGVSKKEIDSIKNKEGLIKTKTNKKPHTALINVADSLKDDIEKHYRYWGSRTDEFGNRINPIEKIIICGGNSNLAGLPEFLSIGLRVPVECADVWSNVFSFDDFIPEINRSDSFSYATAIGLALCENI